MVQEIFCRHDTQKESFDYEYQDASGHRVQVWNCYCAKCGRQYPKKFLAPSGLLWGLAVNS